MQITNFKRSNYNVMEVSSEDNESETVHARSIRESERSSPSHLMDPEEDDDDTDDDVLTM